MTRKHGLYGALPRDRSLKAPILENYLTGAELPKAPPTVNWMTKVPSWPMYLNDTIGDCTCAGMCHSLGAMSYYADGSEVLFADNAVLDMYSAISGYNPVTGANDNGASLAQVCKYMVKEGIADTSGRRHLLAGWAEIEDYTDTELLKQVLYTFGSVYLAFNLPQSAEQQFEEGEPWAPVEGSPIVGGHCVVLQYSTAYGYDDESIITWGAEQKMDIAFLDEYCTEAIALVTADWVDANGTSPSGLKLAQLLDDADELAA